MISYCAKYVTKCEPRFQSLKDVYATILRGLKEDDGALKAVQKLLISTSAKRDYSAQETCHLLLMLPMYMTLLHFVQHYSMPKNIGEEPVARKKMVVVRVRPHCSPDTSGPQYEQYCQQNLLLHKPFREYHQLRAGYERHLC